MPENMRLGELSNGNSQRAGKSGEQSQEISSDNFENQNSKSEGLPIAGNLGQNVGVQYAPSSSVDDPFGRKTMNMGCGYAAGTGI
jgi:hypothetical protein